MKVNVKAIRLVMERRLDEHFGYKDRYTRTPHEDVSLTIHIQREDEEYGIAPMIHSRLNVNRLIDDLRGMTYWRESVSYDDVSYVIKATPWGLEVWHGCEPNITRRNYTFPGAVLADAIESLRVNYYHNQDEYEFPAYRMEEIRRKFAPKAKMILTDDARDEFMLVLHRQVGGIDDKQRLELIHNFQYLMIAARNNSDGDLVTVDVSRDSCDHSFYFEIKSKRGRIMNGGIIAHPVYDKNEPTGKYTYSMHT